MIAHEPISNIGVQRRLTELGRIRLGDKGTKGQPQKLTKFRLTSASRPLLEAAARMYGGTVRAWQGAPDDGFWELYTETDALDIMVPPVMNAYSQLYEVWDAGGCLIRCDGAWESIGERPCDHDHKDGTMPDGRPWVVTTRVSVILPKLPGLGTWRLETKGWNAAATMPAALDMLISGRGWIPAILRLQQESSKKKVPGPNGTLKSQTFRYVVPIIDIIGFTFAELMATGADVPALGSGAVVDQHLPVGPSRPPRGQKVDRPALGPAPALPPVSDFRKPEPLPVATTRPEPPPMASGWPVDDDEESPQDAPGAAVAPEPHTDATPSENVAPVAARGTMTKAELVSALAEARIATDYAATRSREMFPSGNLSDEDRRALFDDLTTP